MEAKGIVSSRRSPKGERAELQQKRAKGYLRASAENGQSRTTDCARPEAFGSPFRKRSPKNGGRAQTVCIPTAAPITAGFGMLVQGLDVVWQSGTPSGDLLDFEIFETKLTAEALHAFCFLVPYLGDV
eukprot:scaffold754_cov248-Pinguiococcus_pyrenoidosus.AAC.12